MTSPLSSCTDYLDRAKQAQDPTQGVLGAGPQVAIQAPQRQANQAWTQ